MYIYLVHYDAIRFFASRYATEFACPTPDSKFTLSSSFLSVYIYILITKYAFLH